MANGSSNRAWWFIAFPLAIVFLFTALPTVVGIGLSFFEWGAAAEPRPIGLENYRALLRDDPQFWRALRNTLIFAGATVPITVLLAFLFAAAVNAPWFRGRTVVRTLFFLPTVVSIVAIGFIWQWILDPQAGVLNHVLTSIGVDKAFGEELPQWTGESPWSLAAVSFIQVWRTLGFSLVLYLAALSSVPRSLYDAASVDGAGSWQALWRIAWPTVWPMTIFLIITGSIAALQVFDLVWIMTGGAERQWMDVLNVHLYREFANNRMGYAAAIGVVVLLLTAIVTLAQLRWMLARGEVRL